VLYLTASAENGSEHPLARALLSYAALRLEGGAALLQEQPADPPALAINSDIADGGSPSMNGKPPLTAEDPTELALQAALLAGQVSRQPAASCL
jgi:cation transport ATPase